MALAVYGKARAFLRNARPGAAQDFPAGGDIPPDRAADLLEGEIERIAQDEDDALQRRKTLEHHEQREGNVLRAHGRLVAGEDRLGEPLAHIVLAPRARVAQPVEAI